MIADTEKIENLKPAVLNKMIKELMMYGSARTVYIGSLFNNIIIKDRLHQMNLMLSNYFI